MKRFSRLVLAGLWEVVRFDFYKKFPVSLCVTLFVLPAQAQEVMFSGKTFLLPDNVQAIHAEDEALSIYYGKSMPPSLVSMQDLTGRASAQWGCSPSDVLNDVFERKSGDPVCDRKQVQAMKDLFVSGARLRKLKRGGDERVIVSCKEGGCTMFILDIRRNTLVSVVSNFHDLESMPGIIRN